MRWQKATQGLLLNLALLIWLLIVGTQMLETTKVGTPLSDDEYEEFFSTFNNPHRVGAICFLRAVYGCKQPLIQMLDQYENHGVIPEGRVCSSSEKRPTFPDFCTLTLYRCAMRKYSVKRVLCPGETSESPIDRQSINQEVETFNLSSVLQSLPKLLHSTSATATTTPTPPESALSIEVVSDISHPEIVVMEMTHKVATESTPSTELVSDISHPEIVVMEMTHKVATESTPSTELVSDISHPELVVMEMTHKVATESTPSTELVSDISHPEIVVMEMTHKVATESTPSTELVSDISHPELVVMEMTHKVATESTPSTELVSNISHSDIIVMEKMHKVASSAHKSTTTPSTTTTLTTPAESVLDLLFQKTTEKEPHLVLHTHASLHSSVPADETTTISELPELHPATPTTPVAVLEVHPSLHTTPDSVTISTVAVPELLLATSPTTTTEEPVLDLLLESSLELLSPTAQTEFEILLKNITDSQVENLASSQSSTSIETTTGSFLQFLTDLDTTTLPESMSEFSISISNVESIHQLSSEAPSTTEASSEGITPIIIIREETTATGSISTTPTITAGKKKNFEELFPTTSSPTTTISSSELPTHHIICLTATSPSSMIFIDSAKHVPKANSSMGIVVMSTFLHHKPKGPLGLIPLLRVGTRPLITQQQKDIPRPQQLPSQDLKKLFLRMQNNRVQHLMREIRDLMSKGERIPNQRLQATSLRLLRALNLANRQKKVKRSLRLKR